MYNVTCNIYGVGRRKPGAESHATGDNVAAFRDIVQKYCRMYTWEYETKWEMFCKSF